MKVKNIIFDFDGVIADSFDFHHENLNSLFPELKLNKQTYSDIHKGNIFNDEKADWGAVDFPRYDKFLNEKMHDANLIKQETVNYIRGLNTKNFVVSSGSEQSIKNTIGEAKLLEYFVEIMGHETHKSKVVKFSKIFSEHSCLPEETLFVTDTLGDVLEAHEVRLKTIAVTFGFHDRQTLEHGKPWKIVDSISELDSVIRELL